MPPDLGPRYRLLRELGRGGSGAVYLVDDAYLKKALALKLLQHLPRSVEETKEIQREFLLLARLEHPLIARAHDFGYLAGIPFFTTEFIPGNPLSDRRPVEDPRRLLAVAQDLAGALAFLHSSDVLHLDVKPSNVIFASLEPRAVLIDFGLCRTGIRPEEEGRPRGSLPYMAPEYFEGGKLGPWTDVYAFGVSLYWLATGAFPRACVARRAGAPDRHWDPAPLPPSRLRSDVPADLDHIVLDCLALDPSSRFQSGRELYSALERLGKKTLTERGARAGAAITVGRERELASADAALAAIRGAEVPPVLVVTAQPGMGQSHFLQELKSRAQLQGIHTYLVVGHDGRLGNPGSVLSFLASHLPAGRGGARGRWRTFLARLRSPRQPVLRATTESERRLRRSTELIGAVRAISEPVLLIVDGLQRLDEISQTLLADLARFLCDGVAGKRPPFGLVLGYREEGASAPILRDLSSHALAAGKARAISLGPLGMAETLDLHRRRSGGSRDGAASSLSGVALYQETGGSPRRIVAMATGRFEELPSSGAQGVAGTRKAASLDPPPRRVLLTLMLLDRPASAEELSLVSGAGPAKVARILAGLDEAGLVQAEARGRRVALWNASESAPFVLSGATRSERAQIHERLAAVLSRTGAPGGDGAVVEAVKHFRLAGDAAGVRRFGPRAARYLKSTFQNRAALELYKAVKEALPRDDAPRHAEAALEIAEIHARLGDFDAGIQTLREVLLARTRLTGLPRLRALLTLAMLHSRRGDFERADAHFKKGLAQANRARSGLSRDDFLIFLNEHAAVKAFTGQYADALALCTSGLRLASKKRSFRSREVALNLQAARANVALRTFDYEGAVRDFKGALEAAEAIGSEANQAIVLNNLGLAYGQSDRYTEAEAALREAERMSRKLDEGPSLASIHGNLAIIRAKLGDFAAAARTLEEYSASGAAAMGRRQELLLTHARGLTLLIEGRYSEAEPLLRAALGLARAMGDRHLAAFEAAYIAEALLFQARYAEAQLELQRLSEPGEPVRVRKLALARLALLHALTARPRKMESAVGRRDALGAEPRVPYLEAWDRTFIGWAFSVSGAAARATPLLEHAEAFFRERGIQPGLSLSLWIQAEGRFLRGDIAGARETLSRSRPASRLVEVLQPLLSARLLLSRPATPDRNQRAADLLAESGRALIANRLPEWECRLRALRGIFAAGAAARSDKATSAREEIARCLPERSRKRYLESEHWKAWTAGTREPILKRVSRNDRGVASTVLEEGTGTASIERGHGARSKLVALSFPMRRLAAGLERLALSDIPVLVVGETGTGKELVARAIHEESGRPGPLRTVDLGSIPEGLLETELFGARAGAFTDLAEDRPGLLGLAGRGTVLFDEIAAATLEAQAKLLRMLSARTYRAVGSDEEKTFDARLIFTSARDLDGVAGAGFFRVDLLHRIRAATLCVPPLRERGEDMEALIPLLAAAGGADPPRIEAGALDLLRRQPWPGNVRELENVLARLRIDDPARITVKALGRILAGPEPGALFPEHILEDGALPALKERLERDYILHHHARLLGDMGALCRFLGVSPRQLYRRADRLRISFRDARKRLGGR